MVDDDDSDEPPSPEPRTDSKSSLPRGFRAWRRLRIVKRDDFFSVFFLPESQYMELELVSEGHQGAHEVGGRAGGGVGGGGRPHPRGQGVGPLVFIFGEVFLLFILRYSVEFQVIPRTFVFCT